MAVVYPQVTHSEPIYSTSMRKDGSNSPWWSANIDKYVTPETRDLFEQYSHIPPNQVLDHIHKIREKAWAIRSYPCTGLGVWLVPNINRSPVYQDIIKRLQSGDKFLDVGCFLGHDLRRLTFDGAPTSALRALDLVSHWDVGYELFQDRERFQVEFVEADLFKTASSPMAHRWQGHVDVISIFHVLHQWMWDDQVLACKRLVELLASKKGSMVVGCQIGNVKAHVWSFKPESSPDYSPQWRHTPDSFSNLWDQVGRETNSTWKSQAWLRTFQEMGWDAKDMGWLEDGARCLEFVVTRES